MVDVFEELRAWPLVYVATPYSLYPLGHCAAWTAACGITARLTRLGVKAYSPIVHMHPLVLYGDFDPLDHEYWMAANRPMIEACHGLAVAKIWGWESSHGIRDEIDKFTEAGKPVAYIERADLY